MITTMMEAVSTSETTADFYQTTSRNIPVDSHLQSFELIPSLREFSRPQYSSLIKACVHFLHFGARTTVTLAPSALLVSSDAVASVGAGGDVVRAAGDVGPQVPGWRTA